MTQLLFLNLGTLGWIILGIFIIGYPLLTLYCLIDIIRSTMKASMTKLLWALTIIFAPFLGSILYLALGRDRQVATL